jgi:hypothetical protein
MVTMKRQIKPVIKAACGVACVGFWVLVALGKWDPFMSWLTAVIWGLPIFVGRSFQVVAVGLIVFTAMGLFELRQTRLRLYAAVEFSFGLLSAFFAVEAPPGWFEVLESHTKGTEALVELGHVLGSVQVDRGIKAAAAVYLMVRAADNWKKGADALTSPAPR